MPILRCSVKTCIHNKKEECCLENIDVSGKQAETSIATACESFQKKSESATNSASNDEVGQPVVSIKCQATTCTHNDDCKCAADHIAVNGCSATCSRETECSTFQKK